MRVSRAEWRVSLSMREVAHPADVQAVRLRQIRRAAEVLRWIVRELPDSDEASKAKRLLEALPKQQ
jgi:ribosomal protein S7